MLVWKGLEKTWNRLETIAYRLGTGDQGIDSDDECIKSCGHFVRLWLLVVVYWLSVVSNPSYILIELRRYFWEHFFCGSCVDAVLAGVYGVLLVNRKFVFLGVNFPLLLHYGIEFALRRIFIQGISCRENACISYQNSPASGFAVEK